MDDRDGVGEDLVKVYLAEIGRHPLLSKDDEVRLAKEVQAGLAAAAELAADTKLSPARRRELRRAVVVGERATRRFIESNLRLVVSIAKRYQASGMPLLDLIQDGNMGLMHAVEKFDHAKGFKFSTYATWWIRQAVSRGVANTSRTVRLPVHASDQVAQLAKAQQGFESRGVDPTLNEIAEAAGVPTDKAEWLMVVSQLPASLDAQLGDDSDATAFGDLVADQAAIDPESAVTSVAATAEVARLFRRLTEREQMVLSRHYGLDGGEPVTLEVIGVELGVTRERVRQIEVKAMAKLRHPAISGLPAATLLAATG